VALYAAGTGSGNSRAVGNSVIIGTPYLLRVAMTDEQVLKLHREIKKSIREFKGNINHLESAIGLIFVTEEFGWKPSLLIHDSRTIKNYEEILRAGDKDFSYRDPKRFLDVGPYAEKCMAWWLVQKGKNFWRAVRGQEPGIRQPTVR